jgi:hypothetical protein
MSVVILWVQDGGDTLLTTYKTSRRHNPEDHNLFQNKFVSLAHERPGFTPIFAKTAMPNLWYHVNELEACDWFLGYLTTLLQMQMLEMIERYKTIMILIVKDLEGDVRGLYRHSHGSTEALRMPVTSLKFEPRTSWTQV